MPIHKVLSRRPAVVLLCCLLVLCSRVSVSFGGDKTPEGDKHDWLGTLENGQQITAAELRTILEDHGKWLKTVEPGEDSTPEVQARPGKANLKGAKLQKADLSSADLRGADLTGANLQEADLSGAKLSGAKLNGAGLFKANLSNAEALGTDLSGAYLWGANLSGAKLYMVNLSGARLIEANLSGADLVSSNLSKAELRGADLSGVKLYDTDLSDTWLDKAILSRASLIKANLSGARLYDTNLSGAQLSGANMSGSRFGGATLSDAELWQAELYNARYEPRAGSLPNISSMATALSLSTLGFDNSPHALSELREAFKKGGMRRQEREVTYAIKRGEHVFTWKEDRSRTANFLLLMDAAFNHVFFDWTCLYGLEPGRPLLLIFAIIPLCSIPYMLALHTKSRRTGIWVVRPSDRVESCALPAKPVKLTTSLGFRAPAGRLSKLRCGLYRFFRVVRIGLYFSLISAFSIGWRELNVGNWIARVQKREYLLRATGWARSVSGLQSIVSAYLLALWALCYFGRPFE